MKHPNVVSYVDDGEFFDNGVKYLYVVMGYVDGEDLSQYIKNNDLKIDESISIFIKKCYYLVNTLVSGGFIL